MSGRIPARTDYVYVVAAGSTITSHRTLKAAKAGLRCSKVQPHGWAAANGTRLILRTPLTK